VPTVLRTDGFRFFFYANEGSEPAHVHVARAEDRAKFWLGPVSLAWSSGFDAAEINSVQKIVRENGGFLLERWNEFFTHS
jgi:hypothetical protein